MTDISTGDWVDRYAPGALRPYCRLARLDRPIGTWLLLFPCWWGLALAAPRWPDWGLMALFALGAMVMRGAGCTYNDIVDRDFDARVERTRTRPIPSGAVSVMAAATFMLLQLGLGAVILFTLDRFAIRTRARGHRAHRDLSLHEAGYLLAAVFPGAQFQLGRFDGLGGGARRPQLGAGAALSRRHRLDARL